MNRVRMKHSSIDAMTQARADSLSIVGREKSIKIKLLTILKKKKSIKIGPTHLVLLDIKGLKLCLKLFSSGFYVKQFSFPLGLTLSKAS